MAIMFPPALREFIEIWVGANVATGNEDRGYDSRDPYEAGWPTTSSGSRMR